MQAIFPAHGKPLRLRLTDTSYKPANMPTPDSKAALWQAILSLMQRHYGEENLLRLSKEAKIGLGSTSRLKAQETSVGVDLIDKVAARFKLEPWQLLVPGFDADRPPELATISPIALDVARMLDAIPDDDRKRRTYALIVQLVEFGSVHTEPEPQPRGIELTPNHKPEHSQ
jgi:hypothetical protein